MKKAIVVGTGAGGATAARELASHGVAVSVFEAGREFKPLTRRISWAEPLRRLGLLGDEKMISRVFPAMDAFRSSKDLVLVRGLTMGGSTVLSCGNMVRADRGLQEIGLDLSPEFQELESWIGIQPFPMKRWRPLTRRMFDEASKLGLQPAPTPKALDVKRCVACGLCELGCQQRARWDARRFLEVAEAEKATVQVSSVVERLAMQDGRVTGVVVRSGGVRRTVEADVVVLAAGGVGSPQILRASGVGTPDRLWADIVLTLGGVSKDALMLREPPMVWFAQREGYIVSPYLDVLSFWFYKPWRKVSIRDRVGVMVKLADVEAGSVGADGVVAKGISLEDENRLGEGMDVVRGVMEAAGVSGPFVPGLPNGGHLGGSVPLSRGDVGSMRPGVLPEGVWVADLSLVPRSQGLPTLLLSAAVALRVARKILEK